MTLDLRASNESIVEAIEHLRDALCVPKRGLPQECAWGRRPDRALDAVRLLDAKGTSDWKSAVGGLMRDGERFANAERHAERVVKRVRDCIQGDPFRALRLPTR